MRASLLVLLFCCQGEEPGDTSSQGDTGLDADTSTPVDTGEPWWADEPGDADRDGYTEADGDCDDGDPAVNPGVGVDTCDGVDEDCDESVDEDFDSDPWEPNDAVAPSLGDLTDVEDTLVYGYLFPEADEDRYAFYVEDEGLSWFDVEVWLYGVPADADYRIDLYWVEDVDGVDRGRVGWADDGGLGGYEFLNHGGSVGSDDSGWYEAVVSGVSGEGCLAPYTLHLLVGTW